MEQTGKGPLREASIAVKVIRADGRVEQLGVVSYYHRNPIRRWAFAAQQKIKELTQWRRS